MTKFILSLEPIRFLLIEDKKKKKKKEEGFWMENYEGDLSDIVRGGGRRSSCSSYGCKSQDVAHQPFCSSQQSWEFSSKHEDEFSFGDPFCGAPIRDPLVEDRGSVLFGVDEDDELIKTPSNVFSRMLHISPPTPTLTSSPSNFLIPSPLHISSPTKPPGVNPRKRQARKVVCVPAPVGGSSSSRPNGELIPSDLWAWRKYGQKPIKGSPYPRGYYRCSSSKGCSARKQVERSRTDPNMLVITYTSEHNHPWPTQRNALAGSSRSQHSKHNSSSKPSPATPQTPTTIIQEDQTKNEATRSSPSSSNNKVKEEVVEEIEKQLETEEHHELSEGFQYRVPAMPSNTTNNNQSDDFFADLEELDTHSLTLFFTRPHKSEQCKGGGGLDDVLAFNPPFDWPPPQNNNNNNNSQIP